MRPPSKPALVPTPILTSRHASVKRIPRGDRARNLREFLSMGTAGSHCLQRQPCCFSTDTATDRHSSASALPPVGLHPQSVFNMGAELIAPISRPGLCSQKSVCILFLSLPVPCIQNVFLFLDVSLQSLLQMSQKDGMHTSQTVCYFWVLYQISMFC